MSFEAKPWTFLGHSGGNIQIEICADKCRKGNYQEIRRTCDAEHQPCGVMLATSLEALLVMFITGKKRNLRHVNRFAHFNFHSSSLNTSHY